ncbi:hypothetical protein AALP_AA4G198400 [Arabis alpina]|uniref:N-acetyltransferase domain-containing protein n=1 Tax=Arabis alpina TaxID=50452 RepID=A0A087H4E0_ARAAL|nr:hypothetical protein AALP_AA4G198400 [Arabis alpina]
MAPKRAPAAIQSSLYPIGDYEVSVNGKNFTCESESKRIQIKFSKTNTVKISEKDKINMFLLLNPRDEDEYTKSHLQEVLKLYSKELPDMKYASNTGKQSAFLERCVSKGKYCSLVLKSALSGASDEILAAITYQIVPADTQYAEIPLAAVTYTHQKKGFGRLVYEELMKRLHSVGIRTIYCWADKESEGFWLKQGFITLAEVDQKGKAKKLHIKSNIRKALCFPGGSTLMVSHPKKESSLNPADLEVSSSWKESPLSARNNCAGPVAGDSVKLGESLGESVYVDCLSGFRSPMDSIAGKEHNNMISDQATTADSETKCSTPRLKRSWEASLSSLQSKRIRANYNTDSEVAREQKQSKDDEQCRTATGMSNSLIHMETRPNGQNYSILLMDIGDENKRAWLTEVIRKLGGDVTLDGNLSTHIVTGKVRKTLNFCTALCSGAWIVSPNWLKESFRQGGFANEASHILQDEEYELKYETDLKSSVLRAKARPNTLLKGYDICIGPHIELPIQTSSAIIKSAGGNVIKGLDKVKEASKAIYIGCEEDTEEALCAAKKGVWTFSSEWLMNCVMKQQLQLQVSQFVESL